MQPTSLVLSAVAILLWAAACATSVADPQPPVHTSIPQPSAQSHGSDSRPGLLLMAHGAGPEWNGRVEAAVDDLREQIPVAIAFGMANPHTLQAAVDTLRSRGVGTVAVVRLFVSGASFLHPTQYLLGLRSDPPAEAMIGHRIVPGSEITPLKTDARILLDLDGLGGSDQAAQILLERANSHAPVPAETGAILIGHGMGDERENNDVLAAIEEAAAAMREHGYAEVRVATLREDWAAARKAAEEGIRAAVSQMGEDHASVVVIPYRVSGFGPYAEVLDGLEYVPTEGLLPHRLITEWIADRATAVLCATGLSSPLGPC